MKKKHFIVAGITAFLTFGGLVASAAHHYKHHKSAKHEMTHCAWDTGINAGNTEAISE